MGKRTDGKFKRRKNDAYFTPKAALKPLLPHIHGVLIFEEPCAGAGDLVNHLEDEGKHCVYSCDIDPQRPDIYKFDAMDIKATQAACFITNPPWTRQILHPMIDHLSAIAPTWLLFDADWMHTKQAIPYLTKCVKIVSVGRVSWMGNGVSGMDNCAWYLFDANNAAKTKFFGRK